MILVDTSVWVDHLRETDEHQYLLVDEQVLMHPWIAGELALGGLHADSEASRLLRRLPPSTVATETELAILIEHEHLAGTGIGYVDSQLLAATRLSSDALPWTRDRGLDPVANRLGLGYRSPL